MVELYSLRPIFYDLCSNFRSSDYIEVMNFDNKRYLSFILVKLAVSCIFLLLRSIKYILFVDYEDENQDSKEFINSSDYNFKTLRVNFLNCFESYPCKLSKFLLLHSTKFMHISKKVCTQRRLTAFNKVKSLLNCSNSKQPIQQNNAFKNYLLITSPLICKPCRKTVYKPIRPHPLNYTNITDITVQTAHIKKDSLNVNFQVFEKNRKERTKRFFSNKLISKRNIARLVGTVIIFLVYNIRIALIINASYMIINILESLLLLNS